MKKLIKEGFSTPGQLQMYIDHMTNISVVDYTTYEIPKPILYSDLETETTEDDSDSLSDDEIQDALDEVGINEVLGDDDDHKDILKRKLMHLEQKYKTANSKTKQELDPQIKKVMAELTKLNNLKEHDEVDMGQFTYDSSINLIKFEDENHIIQGLFHSEYEDLFYKVWIENKSTREIVYKNDYGNEEHMQSEISDDEVDEYLDQLIQYAIDADPRLDESFEYIAELFDSNLNKLKSMKSKTIELKFKNGDSQDVHSDEARVILATYNKLDGSERGKYEDMLNKSTMSFMLAYKKAMNLNESKVSIDVLALKSLADSLGIRFDYLNNFMKTNNITRQRIVNVISKNHGDKKDVIAAIMGDDNNKLFKKLFLNESRLMDKKLVHSIDVPSDKLTDTIKNAIGKNKTNKKLKFQVHEYIQKHKNQDSFVMSVHDGEKSYFLGSHPSLEGAKKFASRHFIMNESHVDSAKELDDLNAQLKNEKSIIKKMQIKKKIAQIEDFLNEKSKDDPCWDSHEMVGMKKKNGKSVPNCVPLKESINLTQEEKKIEKKFSVQFTDSISDVIENNKAEMIKIYKENDEKYTIRQYFGKRKPDSNKYVKGVVKLIQTLEQIEKDTEFHKTNSGFQLRDKNGKIVSE